MNQETIPISKFRENLRWLCHAVKMGKKELTVTYYGKSFFRVIKSSEADNDFKKVSLTFNRDRMTEFIDLLEQNGAVILTAHGRNLVKCELI
jgi:hypothetical protein